MSYLCSVLRSKHERVHLHPPRAHACTFPGTTRAGSGGEKIENSKCKTKTATALFAVPPHRGGGKERVQIMNKKETWKAILQLIASIITAAITALGTASCVRGL